MQHEFHCVQPIGRLEERKMQTELIPQLYLALYFRHLTSISLHRFLTFLVLALENLIPHLTGLEMCVQTC